MKAIKSTDGNVILYNPKIVKETFTDRYVIIFNPATGEETLFGINGHDENPKVLEYPSMIDIGIMGHCENKCPFCYQGDGDEPNMTLELFKKIIDQSKNHTNQCALGGRGDPNLHEHFEEILKYARSNGVVPNYTTSGNNLTQEHINISKKYCGAVAVSMYNQSYTYEALEGLMSAGVKTNIHMIYSSLSHREITRLLIGVDIWSGKINLDSLNAVVLLLFKPQGRGKNLFNLQPSNEQIKLFSHMIKTPKLKFKLGMDSCLINEIAQTRELTSVEKIYADTCEGARMSCYISPTGLLMPCSFGRHNIWGRDITKLEIKDIWDNSISFRNFRHIMERFTNSCPYAVTGW